VDLASYADLAIDLVNTQNHSTDTLRDLDGLRDLLAHRPHLGGRLAHRDLDAMRGLRAQLRAIFTAATTGAQEEAIDRLNSLLIHHPVHPQLARHDEPGWHLHLNEGGSIPDRYAARAAMGLTVRINDLGLDRLGVCHAEDCERAFFDTTTNRSRRFCSDRCASRTSVAAAGTARSSITASLPTPRRPQTPPGP
jgi:predicted RNA-binding Zn ribbon-like protein